MNAKKAPRRARKQAAPTRTVERDITIAAPIDVVWRALTDAEELTRWFPREARVTLGPGGSIWMRWDDRYDAESLIEVWEPPRHLRIVFPAEGSRRLMTDYHLDGRGGSTVLRVVTSGFGAGADWDEYFLAVGTGWDFELRGLRHYLERHRSVSRLVVSAQAHHTSTHAAAWQRLTGPRGWFGPEGLA
jgi:uncharacterized protein YndB with AHSA1/START domain